MKNSNLIKSVIISITIILLSSCDSSDNNNKNFDYQYTIKEKSQEDAIVDSNIFKNLSVISDSEYIKNLQYENHLFFKIDETEYAYLVVSKPSESLECHACGAFLNIYLLENDNYKWKLIAKTDNLNEIGEWGIPPESSILQVSDEKYAIVLHGSYMGQGIVIETDYLLTYFGNKIDFIGEIDVGYDNTGGRENPEEYNYTTIVNQIKNDKEFYDLELIKTYFKEKKADSVATEIFVYNGRKYVHEEQ